MTASIALTGIDVVFAVAMAGALVSILGICFSQTRRHHESDRFARKATLFAKLLNEKIVLDHNRTVIVG